MNKELQIAWAAGLFEGEGSFYLTDKPNGRAYLRLCLATTDHDVIKRFCAVVGAGHIRLDKRSNDWQRKPLYRWHVQQQAEALRIAALFKPYLGERRMERLTELERAYHGQAIPDASHRRRASSIVGQLSIRAKRKATA